MASALGSDLLDLDGEMGAAEVAGDLGLTDARSTRPSSELVITSDVTDTSVVLIEKGSIM